MRSQSVFSQKPRQAILSPTSQNQQQSLKKDSKTVSKLRNAISNLDGDIKKIHVKKLGRSIIGLPLLIPKDNGGVRFIYVKDEPRVALTAELENGLTITTTHLSFAPVVNIYQLNRLCFSLSKLPGKQVLTGDLNIIANLPSRFSSYRSLAKQMTYPSWKEKIQFDYIMVPKSSVNSITTTPLNTVKTNISDHTPIGVELRFQ